MSHEKSSRGYVTIEEVYRRYGLELLRFLHGAHPHLNHQDCEDLLHQAVLQAVTHLHQFDPARGSLRMWVLGILRNEVRQDVRRRRLKPGPLPAPEEEAAREGDVAAAVAAGEELSRVEAALGELPHAQREALLARVRAGDLASDAEVAHRLGIAPGSVAVYRQRAREHLTKALEQRADLRGVSWVSPISRVRQRIG